MTTQICADQTATQKTFFSGAWQIVEQHPAWSEPRATRTYHLSAHPVSTDQTILDGITRRSRHGSGSTLEGAYEDAGLEMCVFRPAFRPGELGRYVVVSYESPIERIVAETDDCDEARLICDEYLHMRQSRSYSARVEIIDCACA